MSTRGKVATLGLLAVGVALLFFYWGGALGGERNLPSGSSGDATAATDLVTVPKHDALPASAEVDSRQEELGLEATQQPGKMRTLRGRAIRVDRFGKEFTQDDGSFNLWTGREELTIEVNAGVWSVEMIPTEYAELTELNLAGRSLGIFDLHSDWELGGTELLVQGLMVEDVLLTVRSAENEEQLSHVDIVKANWPDWHDPHDFAPSQVNDYVVRDANSPIVVPPHDSEVTGQMRYWVRAPGFAWRAIELDHSFGGDREIRLHLGGTLRVEAHGSLAGKWFAVTLFDGTSHNAPSIASQRVFSESRVVEFENVPARLLAARGMEYQAGEDVYDTAFANVRAGSVESVRLDFSRPETRGPAKISGTISLTNRLEEYGTFSLKFSPISDRGSRSLADIGSLSSSELNQLGERLYSFEAEVQRLGPYCVSIQEFAWWAHFDVDDTEGTKLHLELPGLSNVVVELLDAVDKHPIGDEIFYELNRMPFASGWNPNHVGSTFYRGDQPGVYEIRTVESDLTIFPQAWGYSGAFQTHHVSAGDVRLRLELERDSGFVLSFWNGVTRVPCSSLANYRLTNLKGEDVCDQFRCSAGYVRSLGPGTYLLSVTDFDGFAEVRDMPVTATQSGWTPVNVRLEHSW